MNIEEIHEYCLDKPGVTEGFPLNDKALVFKVAGKMFALLDLSEEQRSISLKCDSEQAIKLRKQYEDIQQGYHMNKAIIELFDTQIMVNASHRGYPVKNQFASCSGVR